MSSLRRVVLVVLASIATAACASLLGIEDTKDETAETDSGSGPRSDRVPADDAPTLVPADAGDAAGDARGSCPSAANSPSVKGPTMVRVGEAFCIDSTEVTNAQYKQFIDARAGDAGGQPPECKFNTSFMPYASWPYAAGKEGVPVPDVTWCSARAFCEWAGKRLCGTPGTGAPVNASAAADVAADEWFSACSHAGERTYPYGNTFAPTGCNTDAAAPLKVGTKPGCEGGYTGIFDMSGNVEEWDNACESTTTTDAGPFTDVCYVRGGMYNTALSTGKLACKGVGRLFRGNSAGIRCCASTL